MAKEIDTRGLHVEQQADIVVSGGAIHTGAAIIPVAAHPDKDHLEALAFQDEVIEIMIHESTDQNAENPVQVGVNGIFVQIFRGMPTRVKRKFVDALCVKNTAVATPEYINNAGERAFRIVQRSALKFPFSIIDDRNPKGVEWLRNRVAEAV